jgi:hypothetical protein
MDQPSQVYFPSLSLYKKLEGKPEEINDADRIAVERLFDLIFSIVEKLSPNLQVIITEHANIGTKQYQSALVEERWSDGKALIPKEWIEKE